MEEGEDPRPGAELLRLVQLDGLADRYPSQLSGGQRQRMALARALAVEPQVLLLDEPFGALDAKVRKELRTWLRHLHEEMHVTTIFVTHDQEEAMDVAEQIVVMNEGRVEQSGSADELYEQPANEFVMSFVGEVNRLGDGFVRPHDIDLVLDADERTRRRWSSGSSPSASRSGSSSCSPTAPRLGPADPRRAAELELREGQIVYLRPGKAKSFNGLAARLTGPRLPTTQGRRRSRGIRSRLKRRRAGARFLPGGAPAPTRPLRTAARRYREATGFWHGCALFGMSPSPRMG